MSIHLRVHTQISLPRHLRQQSALDELYGQIDWSVRAIYGNELGWFDGRAEDLYKLPKVEESGRSVSHVHQSFALVFFGIDRLFHIEREMERQIMVVRYTHTHNDRSSFYVHAYIHNYIHTHQGRLVELLGGAAKVLSLAEEAASDHKEDYRWAYHLLKLLKEAKVIGSTSGKQASKLK